MVEQDPGTRIYTPFSDWPMDSDDSEEYEDWRRRHETEIRSIFITLYEKFGTKERRGFQVLNDNALKWLSEALK